MARTILKYFKLKFLSKVPDVFSAIRPIYLFTHLVGLSNYKLTEVNGKKCYKSTILLTVKSLLLLGFLIGIIFYNLMFQEDYNYENAIVDNLNYYQAVMSCTLSLVNVGFGLLFSSKMCKIVNRLHGIDLEFKELGVEIDYGNTFKRATFSMIFIIFAVAIYIGFTSYMQLEQFGYLYFLYSLVNCYPYFLNTIVEFQYANYAVTIRDKYRKLNNYLESLFENVHRAWFIEGNKSSPKIQRPPKPNSDTSSWIDRVIGFHIKLAEIATMLNQAFRIQLLFLITASFIGMVTALFLIAINFKDSKNGDESGSWNYVFTSWAFSNALALVVIVHTTARLCDEANDCPKILHKIRNKTSDSKLHETIEMYSLQMYQNRLQFDVCGLFALDYTLLYSIVASVTTHLVILIQFNSAQRHETKANFNNNAFTFNTTK